MNSFIPKMTEILSGTNPACKLAHRAKLAIIMSYSTTAIGIIVLLKMPYNIDKFSQLYIYIYIYLVIWSFFNPWLPLAMWGVLFSLGSSSKNQKCLSNLHVSFGVNFGSLQCTDPLKVIFFAQKLLLQNHTIV